MLTLDAFFTAAQQDENKLMPLVQETGEFRYTINYNLRGGYRISDKGELLINNKTSGGGGGGGGAVRFRPILRACVRAKHKVFAQKRGL